MTQTGRTPSRQAVDTCKCGCMVYRRLPKGPKGDEYFMILCPLHKAAPELLTALNAIIEECPNPKLPYGIRVVELARAAIKKVEGKP